MMIPDPVFSQMQGHNPQLRAIMRCFMISQVKPGSSPEPSKHSWPSSSYVFVNQAYVDLTKFKKDEKKKTLDIPLDMTANLRNGANQVNIQASSMMSYQIAVQLMRPVSVTELVELVKAKCTISYEDGRKHVLNSFRRGGDDVMGMKEKVSISDPLVLTRIRVPARPSTCRHVNCFDLANFLMMNERIRSWRCPVCNSDAQFKNLIVDGWTMHILAALGPDDSEFIVYPDANWTDERGNVPGSADRAPVRAQVVTPPRAVAASSVTPASARPKAVSIIAIDDSDDEEEATAIKQSPVDTSTEYAPPPRAIMPSHSQNRTEVRPGLDGRPIASWSTDSVALPPDLQSALARSASAPAVESSLTQPPLAPQASYDWLGNLPAAEIGDEDIIIDLTDD